MFGGPSHTAIESEVYNNTGDNNVQSVGAQASIINTDHTVDCTDVINTI